MSNTEEVRRCKCGGVIWIIDGKPVCGDCGFSKTPYDVKSDLRLDDEVPMTYRDLVDKPISKRKKSSKG